MLNLAGVAVEAVSVGGLETCIQLPGYNLAFDIGRSGRSAAQRERVFITHAHIDHLGALAQHAATRGLLGLSPPTYIMAPALIPDVTALLEVWRRLDRSTLDCTLQAMSPGESLPLGKDVSARAFRALHRLPCQGYGIWRQRRRLRAELQGMPEGEIRARRMRGEAVTQDVEVLEAAFCGDTLIDVVDREPALLSAGLLILEVSFLDERVSVESARGMGHVHLDEVIARAELFQNRAILFTHLSARYTYAEAMEVLEARLLPNLKERVTLLPPPPLS